MSPNRLSDLYIDLTAALLGGYLASQGSDPLLAEMVKSLAAFTGTGLRDRLRRGVIAAPFSAA